MEKTNYWTRTSRRRLLQGGFTGSIGLAALALTGCGGGSSTPSTSSSTTPGATSASGTVQPKKGGKYTTALNAFPANLDPYPTTDTNTRGNWVSYVFSHLVATKGVPLDQYPSQDVVADLAEKWETPDNGLTYTFHLNQKAKWTAPIGRPLVADDVVFSWNRFQGKSNAGKAGAAINPEQLSMVDSVTAPDKQTVVIKLKAPNALFLLRVADDYVMPIMAPEVDGKIDPTTTGVGTGPWMVDKLTRPTGYTFKRNPDWHLGPDRPYLDSREFVVVPDPATQLQQFKAGNIDKAAVLAKDIPGIKAALPKVSVVLGPPGTSMPYVAFSSADPNAPWNKDVRVRYALSMSIDRNALWQAFYPAGDYQNAGVEAPKVKWNSVVPVGLGPEWLDPQGSKIDPTLKQYFAYNPDAAKKLLSDAGYPDGVTASFHYTTGYGEQFTTHAELFQQMVAKGGFKLNTKVEDLTTVFQPKTFLGDFDGLAQIYQGYGTALEWFNGMYLPGSTRNQSKVNDDKLTAMINKLNAEPDVNTRTSQVADISNYLIKQMYYVPGMLNAGPGIEVRPGDLHGEEDYRIARSGSGFWAASVWRG